METDRLRRGDYLPYVVRVDGGEVGRSPRVLGSSTYEQSSHYQAFRANLPVDKELIASPHFPR